MEEYEKFCEKSLAQIQIQETSLSTDNFLPGQSESISLIRFHGVAVLSPLLNIEKRKEMQQEKQKALDVEARKQVNRKRVLLTRVQEIIENVQVRKAPHASDFDLWETETIYCHSDPKSLNVPIVFPTSLPTSPIEYSTSVELEKAAGTGPVNHADCGEPNGLDLARDTEMSHSLRQGEGPAVSCPENEAPLESSAGYPETLVSGRPCPAMEESELSLSEEGTPDPYVLSLQNLMKKSKEYLEREQSRRSLRSSGKKSDHESHSDKENEAAKGTDVEKTEKAQLAMGRHCGPVIPDKPSLNKSNVLLQGASASSGSRNVAAWGSLSRVNVQMRSVLPATVGPHPDGKALPSFVPENNVIRSFAGSFAKVPSPEPSLSPKMHPRRCWPSSACHILINNPINACDLSPKGKEPAVGLAAQDAEEKTNSLDTVPKLPVDVAGVGPRKIPNDQAPSEAVQDMAAGKTSQVCSSPGSPLENKILHGLTLGEGQSASDGKVPHRVDSAGTAVPRPHEPCAASQSVASQNVVAEAADRLQPAGTSEKNFASTLQLELNKSYDVHRPSPLLMQSQSAQQRLDPHTLSGGSDLCMVTSFEKVKRKLDLDSDGVQKENCPYVIAAGFTEQERLPLPEKRFPRGSVYLHKNKMLESPSKEGEEMLRSKILAFEEMRQRLEEQHAQQLSLLIAEQEREQERLQKEIEEQEKLLKEKKMVLEETSELGSGKAVDEWRKISDSQLLEVMLTQADSLHMLSSSSSGFTSAALQHSLVSASEAPFYLWGSSASGFSKLSIPRPLGRAKAKWSQVFSAEVQAKFDKITAVARGFLTRRLMQTDKLKQLRQTVKDTMEFIRSFQSEAPLRRGVVSAQDASLQERVLAQLRAALYGIHDIFFVMDAAERMSILHHDREVRKEKMLRQMDKMKSPRVALSAATQKSLDRKKYMKAADLGMPNKRFLVKQNPSEARVLQPNQGQNAQAQRLLSRQGSICRKNPKKAAKCCDNLRRQHSLG
ncbi:centriolar coiled-coil protein of 110 kDa isoform X2 [Suncus etruscus]|uniref:centriolar coiled-coil protein of 110 kDa isoform X2 n=1 Tax=Suncus etruscus TaxID=109475 RepID=UPI0021100C85|nr:centriolar coiled-coil protein of 110 kDa isoform X2 [Suncus etruscus]